MRQRHWRELGFGFGCLDGGVVAIAEYAGALRQSRTGGPEVDCAIQRQQV